MNARDKFKEVNSIKFNRTFKSDEDCYKYLAYIKWDGDNFSCKRCSYDKYCKGKKDCKDTLMNTTLNIIGEIIWTQSLIC